MSRVNVTDLGRWAGALSRATGCWVKVMHFFLYVSEYVHLQYATLRRGNNEQLFKCHKFQSAAADTCVIYDYVLGAVFFK